MAKLHTPLCDRLSIRLPLIQVPMPSASTPELVAAVCQAGALVFPAQNTLTGKLRAAAAKGGNADFIAMWAGQAAPLSRELPAAALVAALEAETLEALDRLAALRG